MALGMNTPSTRPAPRSTMQRRTRGSIIINTAIALSLIVITLVGAELGYLFYVKRELQKTADLAALAGVQKLGPPDGTSTCDASGGPKATARANAAKNFPGLDLSVELTEATCGHWDPVKATPASTGCFVGTDDHFLPAALPDRPENAFRVRIKKTPTTLLPFFEGSRTICVQAVATLDAPVAAFTVGSRLLRIEDNSILPNLLTALGVNPSAVDILSYNGLANASITPAGLLEALGIPISGGIDVGTLNALTKIQELTLGGLLEASILALQNQGNVAAVSLQLLQSLRDNLSLAALQTKVQLFGNESSPGILVGLDSTGNAALNAKVDLLSLVTTGVSIANGRNLVAIDNLGVGILGVQAKARVIEPPSIGIGGIGTIAKTAQVRVYLRVNSSQSILGPVLDILGTNLDIPLVLELAQSTGELTKIDCKAPRHNATIAVSSSQANICVGRFHDMTSLRDNDLDHFFTENNRCSPNSAGVFPDSADGVRRHQLLNVLGILPLTVRVGIPLLESKTPIATDPPLNEPSTPPDETSQTTINATDLDLTRTAQNVADAVAVGILGDLLGQGVAATQGERGNLASSLVGTSNGGRGRSITEVGNGLRWSDSALAALDTRIRTGGLGGLLGGVLDGLGRTLSSLLFDPLADLGCSLALTPSAIHACRVSYVRDSTLAAGENLLSGVLSMVIAILDPVLNLLSQVVSKLLEALGLSIGQTDVSLLSVDCGVAKLVH